MAIPADGSPTTTIDESQPHDHDANGNSVAVTATTVAGQLATDGTPVRAWPRAWDPAQPIDVGGVQGVTTDEEARATQLIQGTLADLPKYADPATAVADGYASIGDAGTGSEHFIKSSLIEDDDMLDPAAPESLVYDVKDGTKTLAGAMYIASARPLDDPSLTGWAGPLMTWHEHNNLCWGVGDDGKPKVVGLTDANGNCARGVKAGGENPMVHVWILPRRVRRVLRARGRRRGHHRRRRRPAHRHLPDRGRPRTTTPRIGGPTATTTAAAVPSLQYDPTKPIDLGGVAGVTPEQQAAAENLVAINVVRLPAVGRLPHRRGRRLPQHRRRRHGLRALHQVGLDQRSGVRSTPTTRRASCTPRSPTARSSSSARCTCCRAPWR